MDFEAIIGFETHVELKTRTKLFCDCPVKYEIPPNSAVCPVCTGQPGALPVLNRRAVEHTIRAGLALHCDIRQHARFARKNYFYPDLPKGYQISQYERPFCENGFLEIAGDDGRPYAVGIKRIHLEEDAGKLVHSSSSLGESEYSLVDYNRSSVPLMEIVTDHERNPIRSVSEARTYLEKLRQILQYIEVSDCIIERGQFRCDVNISIRPRASREFGTRSEIKNMASFRYIMNALEYEIKRQSEVLQGGGPLAQETRLFDEQKKITLPMRGKEDAPDYRYFPDPDLLEIEIDQGLIDKIEDTMPELPDRRVARLTKSFGIPKADVLILTKDKGVSDFFEKCAAFCTDIKRLSRWMVKDLFKLLNDASLPIEQCPVSPRDFSDLIDLIGRREITDRIGRAVLQEMFAHGGTPDAIIQKRGLRPIQDMELISKVVEEVLAENPDTVRKIKDGDKRPVDFLIGQVMKKTKGKADPKGLRPLIEKMLSGKNH